MSKKRLATVWLDGCSGCHMSLLDCDEAVLDAIDVAQLVYSPLCDAKEFPEGVDVTLVEGAVSSEDDLKKLRTIRERSKIIVALGDCAVTGNVPAMRNPFPVEAVLDRVYIQNATASRAVPSQIVPKLLPAAHPLHDFVNVDVYVPGCPPSPETIRFTISELVEGRVPELGAMSRFGA